MKLKNLIGIVLLIGILSSCQQKNEDLKYLPSSTNFVMTLQPSVLQEKSGIDNIAQTKSYSQMIENLDSADMAIFNQFKYVFENYEESGINMNKPIFVFSSSKHNGYNKIAGINFILSDKSKFSKLIEKIVSNANDSLEVIDDENLKVLVSNKNSSHVILAWNNTTVIGLRKINGSHNRKFLIDYAKELLSQSSANSLSSNKDFASFYENKEDVSLWFNSKFYMQQLPAEYKTIAKMQMPISLDNVYFHYFIAFDKGEMKMKSEIILPDDLKHFLKDYNVVKPNIDKKMMSFIPKNSLMNISFAINPPELLRMIRDLYSERQIDTKGMEQLFEMATNIKVEKLFHSISGDFIFNVHGVSIVNNDNDSIYNKKAKWLFSTIIKLDDKSVYQWIVNQVDKNDDKMVDGYIILNENENSSLYMCMRDSYVMLTNDKSLIIGFSKDKALNESLSDSKIAKKIDNYSAYAEFNLDYSTYPNDVKQYFDTKYDENNKIPFKKKVSQVRFEPIDSYTAELIVEFKDKTKNSLSQIMAN
jgi:hypothetical protein